MKTMYCLLIFLVLFVIVGCQISGETMVLLDEKIEVINVSAGNEVGNINTNTIISLTDKESIEALETVIRTAVKQKVDVNNSTPDFDILVEYAEGFPGHPIHLWLAEDEEPSTLMYIVDEERVTYKTTSKSTIQLRELLMTK
ncbi:hypothetical protein [Aquibacillus rhizosphaerae]|uniref:YhfM-like domain-containing protein n=1 Tax=Aquibacillus rhizosphaerae TaxID=3051431 RepID=A0ABT7L7I1_9BACI|nr:hypothetical protein [Aquibacillus sp. LR5S19]MDL4841783.1 hypothetical protein [Aquibacillus sp. LR5S19]